MAYGADFRLCVVRNMESGMAWEEAERVFGVCRGTIGSWLRRYRKTGQVAGPPRKTYKPRKIDSQQLLKQIEETPDATLEELAEPFGCCHQAIDQRLRKLGITRKKNHPLSGARRAKKASVSHRA